jgi:hypothetical protein
MREHEFCLVVRLVTECQGREFVKLCRLVTRLILNSVFLLLSFHLTQLDWIERRQFHLCVLREIGGNAGTTLTTPARHWFANGVLGYQEARLTEWTNESYHVKTPSSYRVQRTTVHIISIVLMFFHPVNKNADRR